MCTTKKLGSIDMENANDLITYYEEKIVSKPVEYAISVCANGDVYLSTGTSKSVIIDPSLDLYNSIITHNHPKGETSFSFSGDDLGLFFERGIKILRGIDYKYSYTIERTSDTIIVSGDSIESEFYNLYKLKAGELSFQGKLDIDEDGYDYVLSVLSQKYHFSYRRERR